METKPTKHQRDLAHYGREYTKIDESTFEKAYWCLLPFGLQQVLQHL